MLECIYPFCRQSAMRGSKYCSGHGCRACGGERIGDDFCQNCLDKIEEETNRKLRERGLILPEEQAA